MINLEAEITTVLENVLSIKFSDLDFEPSSGSVESWDSLAHINIVLSLEELLSISFTEREIESMTSFSAIKEIVGKKLIG